MIATPVTLFSWERYTSSRSFSLVRRIEKSMFVVKNFLQCRECPEYAMDGPPGLVFIDRNDASRADAGLVDKEGGSSIFRTIAFDIALTDTGVRNVVENTDISQPQHGRADGHYRSPAHKRRDQRKDLQVVSFLPLFTARQQQDVDVLRVQEREMGMRHHPE